MKNFRRAAFSVISRRFSPGLKAYNGEKRRGLREKKTGHCLPPRIKKAVARLRWPVLGFLLCAGQMAGVYAPFALAAVTAAGIRLPGLAAVMGVAGGAFLFMDFQSACGVRRRPSSSLPPIRRCMTRRCTKNRISARPARQFSSCWCRASICWAAAGRAGFWPCVPPRRRRAQPGLTVIRQGKWGVLCGLVLAAVPVTAFSFSVGRALMMALLLALCRGCGISQCAALGGCLGLLTDLTAAQPTVLYTVIWGAGGAVGGLLRRLPRPIQGLCAAGVCGGLGLLFGQEVMPVTLWESLAGAMLYTFIPEKWLPKRYTAGKRSEGAPQPMPYARPAAALRALYDSFFRGEQPQPSENPSVLFDRAANEVCSGCVLRTDCWQKHYGETYSAFNDACPGCCAGGGLRRRTSRCTFRLGVYTFRLCCRPLTADPRLPPAAAVPPAAAGGPGQRPGAICLLFGAAGPDSGAGGRRQRHRLPGQLRPAASGRRAAVR